MDLNSCDFDLDLENETELSESSRPARAALSRLATHAPRASERPRTAKSLTNSPGCTPAPEFSPECAPRPIRSVRTDAWSVPASTSWARPSRALRKVARRALETEMVEPA